MNSEMINPFWMMVKVEETAAVIGMEFENQIERLIADNKSSGRSMEAQIAVENTLKMMGHMRRDLTSFHMSELNRTLA